MFLTEGQLALGPDLGVLQVEQDTEVPTISG